MKVFYRSPIVYKELAAGSVFRTTPCKAYLELELGKNEPEYDAVFNGVVAESGSVHFDCDANAELIIRQKGEKFVYIVKPLVDSLSNEYSLAYEQFSFEHMDAEESGLNEIESIRQGKLRLYAVDQSADVHDWTEVFDQIESAFSAFKYICQKPKSHLRAVNEVRPIETVKRIGYESIPYLAAHSEDWLARTASGLKPARLFSRVEDDEYQIYENRVVKTLIDLIIFFLRKREKELKDQYEQLHGIINSSVQTGSFGFDVSFQKAVSELLKADNKGDAYRSKSLELADTLHQRAYFLLKKYRTLRATRLYRYLKKSKPATNPLNETNILLMDKHYNVIFSLWKNVHKEIAPREVEEKDRVAFDNAYADYLCFCKTLCGYTAHVLNFHFVSDGNYLREADNLGVIIAEEADLIHLTFEDRTKRFVDVPESVALPIAAGERFECFSYDGMTLFWDNTITTDEIERFCSKLKTRESRGREQAEEKKKYSALKILIDQRQREYDPPMKRKIVIYPAVAELENETRSSFKAWCDTWGEQYLSEHHTDAMIIALPKCDDNEQKIVSYAKQADEQLLILPLTMFDINSFRRLQNVFLRQISVFDTGKCPCCGGTMRDHGNQLVCDNCNQLVLTKTVCPNPKCKKSYPYISYDVSADTLSKMQNVDRDNFFQVDSLYQYKDIVEMSVNSGKIRTVCPYCGE